MNLLLDRVPSPIGAILLVSDGEALRALDFDEYEERMHRLLRRYYGACSLTRGRAAPDIRRRLSAYFDGELTAIDAIPVRTGGSAFQRQVWAALRRIPAGTTTSYGRLAAMVGAPKASRAVGLANGANPIALVVPCHRVIGADSSLTGYGGGLPRKAWLLRHEGLAFPSEHPDQAFRSQPRGPCCQ
ncbi:MAG: methylated-DNA--[protein]-cysteine S-methyltransferase [Acidisphaera sp.]|nr:methylated-DNA--[protein]-cysteine S-methyltransferase [Acidisphaera sp.]